MTFIGYYNCVNAFGIYTPKSNVNRWQGLSPSLSQLLSVSLSFSQVDPNDPKDPSDPRRNMCRVLGVKRVIWVNRGSYERLRGAERS